MQLLIDILRKAGDLSCSPTDHEWSIIVFCYKLNGVETSITLPEVLLTYESFLRDLDATSKSTISAFLFWCAQCSYTKAKEGYEGYHKWKQTQIAHTESNSNPDAPDMMSGIPCQRQQVEVFSERVHNTVGQNNSVVICGHTHKSTVRSMKGFKYVNSGGWNSSGKRTVSYVEVLQDKVFLHTWNKDSLWVEHKEQL